MAKVFLMCDVIAHATLLHNTYAHQHTYKRDGIGNVAEGERAPRNNEVECLIKISDKSDGQ